MTRYSICHPWLHRTKLKLLPATVAQRKCPATASHGRAHGHSSKNDVVARLKSKKWRAWAHHHRIHSRTQSPTREPNHKTWRIECMHNFPTHQTRTEEATSKFLNAYYRIGVQKCAGFADCTPNILQYSIARSRSTWLRLRGMVSIPIFKNVCI